jgi:hypothetical protein
MIIDGASATMINDVAIYWWYDFLEQDGIIKALNGRHHWKKYTQQQKKICLNRSNSQLPSHYAYANNSRYSHPRHWRMTRVKQEEWFFVSQRFLQMSDKVQFHLRHKVIFFRIMATMVNASLTVLKSLTALKNKKRKKIWLNFMILW